MDFLDADDPLNYYPDWDEELIPPENIYWMTNVPTKEEMEEREKEINEDNYDVFPALSPSGEPTIYTPFKSLEEVEKVVKELNKDQNK